MKYYYKYLWVVVIAAGLAACNNKYLDVLPESSITPDKFFKSESDMKMYANSFYTMLPGGEKLNYTADYPSDDFEGGDAVMQNEETGLIIPSTGTNTDQWTWGDLRNINYFILHCKAATGVSDSIKNQYLGVGRFFRAWFYYNKVKRFGDVPFVDTVLSETSSTLYKARDSRILVMDSILSDLDFAIANCSASTNINTVSKYTAMALKSRIALFEGTWRKYHTEVKLTGANELLQAAADAAEILMASGKYSLHNTGNPNTDYASLFNSENALSDEVILARSYGANLANHSTNYVFIGINQGKWSATKSLMNTYLMKTGKPFTEETNYDTLGFYNETQNRDPRMAQTVRTPGYTRMGSTQKQVPDFQQAVTGYQFIKYVTTSDKDNYMQNTNDYAVVRYAEVLLNYAEAKAELGTLTQQDLDKTVGAIRSRAGMPGFDIADANINPDHILESQYTQVSGSNKGVILEIRRERRVELAMEGFRYDDIRRWKEGHLVRETYNGMYVPAMNRMIDLDGDGKMDVIFVSSVPTVKVSGMQYVVVNASSPGTVLSQSDKGNIVLHPDARPSFQDYQYLYPIPVGELTLNPNLKQNLGYN